MPTPAIDRLRALADTALVVGFLAERLSPRVLEAPRRLDEVLLEVIEQVDAPGLQHAAGLLGDELPRAL